MVRTPHHPRSHCPINFGLEIFGDRWTLLVLRDVLIEGKRSFKEFQASAEGIASNILAERLGRLEKCGLLTRSTADADGRQVSYTPTDACRMLVPVLVEMAFWGATHDPKTAAPASFLKAYKADRATLISAITNGFNPSKS